MQPGVGVKWRSDQLQNHGAGAVGQFGGGCRQPGLPDPRLAAKHHTRQVQSAGQRRGPGLLKKCHLTITAHQGTTPHPHRLDALAEHLMMHDRSLDALCRGGRAALQLEARADKRCHRIGDHHRPWRRQARYPRGHVGAQPVHVSFGAVQVHQPAVHPHPYADTYPKPALRLLAEPGHLVDDLQTRMHRAAHIVLMGYRIAENRQKSIALAPADIALEAMHDRLDLLAVAADQQALGLRLHATRQVRRIHQVGDQDRQSANLTGLVRCGQQVLCIDVALVGGQDLLSQRVRGHPVTTVDRRDRPIQKLIDRRRFVPCNSVTDSRVGHPAVAYIDIVSPPLDQRC